MSGFKPAVFVLPLFICSLPASSEGGCCVVFTDAFWVLKLHLFVKLLRAFCGAAQFASCVWQL